MRRYMLAGAAAGLLAALVSVSRPAPVSAQSGRGVPFNCVVEVSTATTLTAVGGQCQAPGPGLTLFITDILMSTNAGAIAADSFSTLKSGTGSACGTGTLIEWGVMTPAATQASVMQTFATPIKLPANSDLCWINSTAGSKFWVINGYIAPF